MLENAVLITGAAHRIGAEIAKTLHHAGYSVLLHYRNSDAAAMELAETLNSIRPHSAMTCRAELCQPNDVIQLAKYAKESAYLVGLVNNASSFYPTEIGTVTSKQWDDLLGSNLRAPFFLSQSLMSHLKETRGSIVNIVDIHSERPLKNHPAYSIAKAGLAMLTRSFALEMGPEIRVNGISPGAILWPETQQLDDQQKQSIIEKTALKRTGSASDIARTVLFLFKDAPYVTGQIIAVDGGRSL